MVGDFTYEYSFGDIVFLKTDIEQLPYIVTGYALYPLTSIKYILSNTVFPEISAYSFELTKEKLVTF